MRHLVYCVLPEGGPDAGPLPAGVEGCPVGLVAAGGLAAASSAAPAAGVAPTIAHVAAYSRVIEALHKVCTVLPFRYGHWLDGEAPIVELLRAHESEFRASLALVEGCLEMGLRILVVCGDGGVRPGPHADSPSVNHGATNNMGTPASGKAYLADRKVYYAWTQSADETATAADGRARRAFDGLYVKSCEDRRAVSEGRTLVSLSLLVRREHVERFRDAFRGFPERDRQRVLLSGPWPPYSFAGGGCMEPDTYVECVP
jgi:hypothetical protein